MVNDPGLTRSISRRCAIARRRRRSITVIDDVRYAYQPRTVPANVGARAALWRRAGDVVEVFGWCLVR
jgi:hypothetical protein